ncbi:MAG: hypothetical protein RIB58_11600 [Phycisphaerales bacterium]
MAFIATLLVGILAPPPAIAQQTSYVTWTEREYVYTPGYIDEFVAEYDADGEHWPVLQDANFNAVALAHRDGRVARQRVLSPHGRVLQEDSGFVSGSPKTRIGHQGLFAERLDADTQQDPQAAGAFIAWHNRNRTLLSEYGRFGQRDPYGSGMPLRTSLASSGHAVFVEHIGTASASQFMNGVNIYAYVMSTPTQESDPTGLFGFFGGMMTGLQVADSSFDAMDMAYMGVSTGFGVWSMIQDYSSMQQLDAMWAEDWDSSDSYYEYYGTADAWGPTSFGGGGSASGTVQAGLKRGPALPGKRLPINPRHINGTAGMGATLPLNRAAVKAGGGIPDFAKKDGASLVSYVKAMYNHPHKPATPQVAQEIWDMAKRDGVSIQYHLGHTGSSKRHGGDGSARYSFPHFNIGGRDPNHGRYHVALPMGWRPR